jgi:hypothetical protein
VKISFRRIKGMDAPEHFYKSMTQDIGRLIFIDSIAHGNGHTKAIQLPEELLLRLPAAIAALNNDAI